MFSLRKIFRLATILLFFFYPSKLQGLQPQPSFSKKGGRRTKTTVTTKQQQHQTTDRYYANELYYEAKEEVVQQQPIMDTKPPLLEIAQATAEYCIEDFCEVDEYESLLYQLREQRERLIRETHQIEHLYKKLTNSRMPPFVLQEEEEREEEDVVRSIETRFQEERMDDFFP